jgi:hypothetical protein
MGNNSKQNGGKIFETIILSKMHVRQSVFRQVHVILSFYGSMRVSRLCVIRELPVFHTMASNNRRIK